MGMRPRRLLLGRALPYRSPEPSPSSSGTALDRLQALAEPAHGAAEMFLALIFTFGHAHDVVTGKLGQFEARADHPGLRIH